MSRDSNWAEYNKAEALPRPRLVTTLDRYFSKPGSALDLGCGSGRDTLELLRRGWRVTAVDSDRPSLEKLKTAAASFQSLEVIEVSFKDLQLPDSTYDLINASYALPFCAPQYFQAFWDLMRTSLKVGGIASFELFGVNDDWAKLPRALSTMNFHSRDRVELLLKDLKIEMFKEDEFRGPTASGPEKHWHIYSCVVRKP